VLKKNPLVSIVVVTFNSSKFVLETLESAKKQIYQNVELIITDDCSTDGTIEICKKWIDENQNRFINIELITVEKNTGTAANANRGLKASSGEWIKFIAGDDMLMPNFIDELIRFVQTNNNLPMNFIVHGIVPFRDGEDYKAVFPPEKLMQKNAKDQLTHLLKRGNSISGSAFFLKRSTLLELEGFDERYRLYEDFPLIVKYTQNNYKLWLFNKPIFRYRIHSTNISFERSFLLKDSYIKFKKEILFPLLLERKLYLIYWHRYIQGRQKHRFLSVLLLILSPIGWIDKIYRVFGHYFFYNHKAEFQKTK